MVFHRRNLSLSLLALISIAIFSAAASAVETPSQANGSLRVLIQPSGAVGAGALWRLLNYSERDWYRSGETVSGIPPGRYTVEFLDMPGWNSPPPLDVAIVRGRVAMIQAVYREQKGQLTVAIRPREATYELPAPVFDQRWHRVGSSTWYAAGETEYNVPAGTYNVEFMDIFGWIRPGDIRVTVRPGEITSINATYARSNYRGALTVVIGPDGAAGAGAQWRRLGTTTWHRSGQTETGVPEGEWIIEFRNVNGWEAPKTQRVRVDRTRTARLVVDYIGRAGELKVSLQPREVSAAGAMWRLSETGSWFRSGYTATGISPGTYTVEFKKCEGWIEPESLTVRIEPGKGLELIRSYVPEKGSLTVSLGPPGAVAAGAKWRVTGLTDWRAAGGTKTNLPPGMHTIEFKELRNWEKPRSRRVRIENGRTAEISADYKPYKGSLTVTIEPQRAVEAGAEWRLKGTDNWHKGGWKKQSIPAGDVIVQFKTIKDWNKPDDIIVTVSPNREAKATGVYKYQRRSTLTVTILPRRVIALGARWRPVGTGEWLESGQASDKITPGEVEIEFKSVEGWKKPARQKIAIPVAEDVKTTANYVKKK